MWLQITASDCYEHKHNNVVISQTQEHGNDISKICLIKPVDDTTKICSTLLSQKISICNIVLLMHPAHLSSNLERIFKSKFCMRNRF